jgi:hypothetical protein
MRLTTMLAAAAAAVGLAGCASPRLTTIPSPSTGTVIGGISRCDALGISGPRYVPGTLTVLKGEVRWQPSGPGSSQAVFPEGLVTREEVGATGMYRLQLRPGTYVLRAAYVTGNVEPWVRVVVQPGVTTRADIPNMCV